MFSLFLKSGVDYIFILKFAKLCPDHCSANRFVPQLSWTRGQVRRAIRCVWVQLLVGSYKFPNFKAPQFALFTSSIRSRLVWMHCVCVELWNLKSCCFFGIFLNFWFLSFDRPEFEHLSAIFHQPVQLSRISAQSSAALKSPFELSSETDQSDRFHPHYPTSGAHQSHQMLVPPNSLRFKCSIQCSWKARSSNPLKITQFSVTVKSSPAESLISNYRPLIRQSIKPI